MNPKVFTNSNLTNVQRVNNQLRRHKWERRKHLDALSTKLTLETKIHHLKCLEIQNKNIVELKKRRELAKKDSLLTFPNLKQNYQWEIY